MAYSQGKLITDTIVSTALQGNKLADPETRKMSIYLPPSYENGGKYPVVYILTSIGDETKAGLDNLI
ncbi:hypothetical protein H8E77_08190 [bacterium]|nr:hypothetical protein [bacterium]